MVVWHGSKVTSYHVCGNILAYCVTYHWICDGLMPQSTQLYIACVVVWLVVCLVAFTNKPALVIIAIKDIVVWVVSWTLSQMGRVSPFMLAMYTGNSEDELSFNQTNIDEGVYNKSLLTIKSLTFFIQYKWKARMCGGVNRISMDSAPDIQLYSVETQSPIRFHSIIRPGRPLVVLFGNISCPYFRAKFEEFCKLASLPLTGVDFGLVYTRETFPIDGWSLTGNTEIKQHKSLEDRLLRARSLKEMNVPCPVWVDSMSDEGFYRYGSFPCELFIILDRIVIFPDTRGKAFMLHQVWKFIMTCMIELSRKAKTNAVRQGQTQ